MQLTIIIISIFILAILLLMFLNGYWEIVKVEEISNKRYTVKQRDRYGEWVGDTDETVIITKTTFRNGRTRYKTIKLES